MEEESIVILELGFLASNSKKEGLWCFIFYFNFKESMKKRRFTKCFFMLDPRFKNLHLVFSFIGLEKGKAIVEEYDKKNFVAHIINMWSEIATIDQNVDEDCNLDTFEIITSISDPAKELVDKELLIFTKFQVDAKDIKCPLQW
jgi:hypothetical protein